MKYRLNLCKMVPLKKKVLDIVFELLLLCRIAENGVELLWISCFFAERIVAGWKVVESESQQRLDPENIRNRPASTKLFV